MASPIRPEPDRRPRGIAIRLALVEACKRFIFNGTMAAATDADLERAADAAAGDLARHCESRTALIDMALASIRQELLSPAAPAEYASAAATPPRRERVEVDRERRLRTRIALLEAAKRLIGSGGIDAASIDTLVREADVGKGSFFNHFESREALVRAVLETARDALDRAIVAATQGPLDPVQRLARSLVVALRYRVEHGLGARAILVIAPDAVNAGAPANAMLRDHLQAAIDAGAIRVPSLDAGLAVVLGISELGLARLLDEPAHAEGTSGLMQALCITMLAALGVDARRHARLSREAVAAVVAAPPSRA